MIDLHRILVPTDFSKHSHNALTYAAAFAEKFGAELYLLHVVQDLALFIPEAVSVAPPAVPPIEQMTAAVREALDRRSSARTTSAASRSTARCARGRRSTRSFSSPRKPTST